MAVRDKTTKKKRRGARGIIASALSLCVLIALALLLVPGGPGPGWDGMLRWISGDGVKGLAGQFSFSQGTNSVFADLGDAIAAAGELGIQVLGSGGTEKFREQLRLSKPVIEASGDRALVYDLGGRALRVIDSGGVLCALEADNAIVSASINEKGWHCVSTQASGGLKSVVMVYSNKGAPAYKLEIASGYVLDARINRDNKNLAILSVTDTGGRVTFYSRDTEEPLADYNHTGEVILAIRWLPDGRVVAVTDSAALIIDKDGNASEIYSFSGRYYGGMCISGGDFIALYLLDYGIGNAGRLVTLGTDGSVLAQRMTADECRAMSIGGGTLAVLWDTGIALYDGELNESFPPQAGKTYTDVLAISGGRVLAIGPRESLVLG